VTHYDSFNTTAALTQMPLAEPVEDALCHAFEDWRMIVVSG
jgi:hypothetical protein